MIPDIHNAIWFWGGFALVYVYFQFQQPPEISVIINPTQEQYENPHTEIHSKIHEGIHQERHKEVRIMCWNELTQTPKECKK